MIIQDTIKKMVPLPEACKELKKAGMPQGETGFAWRFSPKKHLDNFLVPQDRVRTEWKMVDAPTLTEMAKLIPASIEFNGGRGWNIKKREVPVYSQCSECGGKIKAQESKWIVSLFYGSAISATRLEDAMASFLLFCYNEKLLPRKGE